jgi:hypothetical protein
MASESRASSGAAPPPPPPPPAAGPASLSEPRPISTDPKRASSMPRPRGVAAGLPGRLGTRGDAGTCAAMRGSEPDAAGVSGAGGGAAAGGSCSDAAAASSAPAPGAASSGATCGVLQPAMGLATSSASRAALACRDMPRPPPPSDVRSGAPAAPPPVL